MKINCFYDLSPFYRYLNLRFFEPVNKTSQGSSAESSVRKYDSVTSFGNHVHLRVREGVVDLKRNTERKEGAAIGSYKVYGIGDGA